MRSSTDVYVRNCASAGGSRDRSSRRKYSDTNRSLPVKSSIDADCGAPACRDSAARYRPDGQPSVRSVSSESLGRVELDADRLQQQPGLLLVQSEVRDADLLHPPLRPPAGKRQCRRLAARDRDLRAVRNVLERAPRGRPGRIDCRRGGDRPARARSVARIAPWRPRRPARSSSRRTPLGRTALPGPRPRPPRHRTAPPRCTAETPWGRRRPARRATPRRTHEGRSRPTGREVSSCRTRPVQRRSRGARPPSAAVRSRPPSPPSPVESTAERA